jgi:pantoate--beta-alanine ligase
MILFKKEADLRNWLDVQQKKDRQVGFVPTMGALHQGHISLIKSSKSNNAITVCSIFVNPTQFNDRKDFNKYPTTPENDIYLLEKANCDVLFMPSEKEIYPGNFKDIYYDLGYLETILEGKYRPGHFQGVCKVMDRLLNIVRPGRLYLGQKDYQQCMVIKKLVDIIGFHQLIEIIVSPTLRENDGLAMSSRNMRLDKQSRQKVTVIFKSLCTIKENLAVKDIKSLKKDALIMLEENGFKVDYVEIADANDLSIINEWDGRRKIVALIAAFINDVRLIDNMILN